MKEEQEKLDKIGLHKVKISKAESIGVFFKEQAEKEIFNNSC